jgi:signal transduction histidine kinase
MRPIPELHWRDLFSPLALASYAAWMAVYLTNSGWLTQPGTDHTLAAQLLMLGFLAAWMLMLTLDLRRYPHTGDVGLVVLTGCALGLLMLGQSGSGPILLVLLATQLAARFQPREMMICLVVVNLAFLLIMLMVWDHSLRWALITATSYVAFQAFAALTMHYAVRSEEMAEELREVNAHLLATRELLSETARDQERLRLSRELHDVAGHKLTALKLNLRNLSRQQKLENNEQLTTASSLAGELLEDLRAVVRQLRDHDGIDLAAGIRKLIEPLPSPQVVLELDESARIPRAEQAEALLRFVQEGLTNAARHGRAQRAWLTFGRFGDEFAMQLEDNGRLSWPVEPGNGLTGMRERLEALGGNLELKPSDNGGLKLTARLPVEPGS